MPCRFARPEEQCEHLGLDVKHDFAPLAARSDCPADLGARCTVFMETELLSARRNGAGLPDLAARLARSVARNYLQKVVGARPVGRRVVFQGGVASNAAVVAAFEAHLGREVRVHPYNGVSGAIGVALLTRDAMGSSRSTFRGLGAIGPHTARTFECRHCENRCKVTQIQIGAVRVHVGDTCELFTVEGVDLARAGHLMPWRFTRDAMRAAPAVPDRAADLADRPVYVPYFSDHAHALVGALRYLGRDAHFLPLPDDPVVAAGEEIGSGKECHVYSMMLGDVIRLAQRTDRPVAYFYPGTRIPCLLSQFADGFRMDLAQRGLTGVTVLGPNSQELVEILGVSGASQLWRGFVAVDLLVRWLCGHRPYERSPGAADRAHRENLADLVEAQAVDDIGGFLRRAVARMESVECDRSRHRPLIGIAGDIYTRVNDAANLGLWKRLESMGCEVWPAPFMVDSVEFWLAHEFTENLRAGHFQEAFVTGMLLLQKDLGTWGIRRDLLPHVDRAGEPGRSEVLHLASPYIGPGSQSTLLLNVAKIVDFARRGADGVINAMCMNCMFGTVSAALIERIRRDHGGLPVVTLVYTGTETAALRTKLETFVHQVIAFHEARAGREGASVPA